MICLAVVRLILQGKKNPILLTNHISCNKTNGQITDSYPLNKCTLRYSKV